MKITKALGLFSIALLGLGLAANRASAQSLGGGSFTDPGDTIGTVIFTLDNTSPKPEVNSVSGPGFTTGAVPDGAGNYFLFQDTDPATGSGDFVLSTLPTSSYSSIQGTDLLSGTFSDLTLILGPGDPTDTFTTDLTYSGGTDLPILLAGATAGDTGTLDLTLDQENAGLTTPPLYAFDNYGTDFSVSLPSNTVTGTPEPNPAITIGIAAAGILGLVMLRKKQSSVLS